MLLFSQGEKRSQGDVLLLCCAQKIAGKGWLDIFDHLAIIIW